MYEVELKVPADHEQVRRRLDALNATHVETVRQEDTYYDAPDRNFAETDEALRIRRERIPENGTETALVTYKGPLVDSGSKTREEAETAVDDDDAMAAILTGLGYEPAATVAKERERYALEDCTVTLDTVEGLGEFVEVERDTEANVETAAGEPRLQSLRDELVDLLEELGLDAGDQIRTSYLGLLLERDASG